MQQTITNKYITVTVDTHGAELQSIINNRTGQQYLWQGDKRYWGRRSPVLFPFVGAVANGHYRYADKEYPMTQHGFARDMEFTPMTQPSDDSEEVNSLWFFVESSDKTREIYPFDWRLEIGYIVDETRITVCWRVINKSTSAMPFQIGAHPAFNYPDYNPADSVHGYFAFDRHDITYELIEREGCLGDVTYPLTLDDDGMYPITNASFDKDALIIGGNRIHRVSMLTKQLTPYITLLFRAPIVGLWSKPGDAPFVCIEPWWGRCDRVDFNGELSEREYENLLEPGKTFSADYMILIDNI
ncbi:MAG: aldose 1-epimerase family protein [Pseudoflavonifractor sp.]|nr:aldose 1-epimerase family protein [Pseudoflavonifractor sp.]